MGIKGKFITFEGSEGSGKSTQIRMLAAYLESKGKKVLVLREPGGVRISEDIRDILLDIKNKNMTDICETLLYMAARAQIVEEVIAPALRRGTIVLCDRFLDSTVAYQGYGNGVDVKFIKEMGRLVTQRITPDITFLFDLSVKEGLSRRGKIRDRIEHRSLIYHNRVRQGYLKIARAEPRRIKIIKADRDREVIQKDVCAHLKRLLKISL